MSPRGHPSRRPPLPTASGGHPASRGGSPSARGAAAGVLKAGLHPPAGPSRSCSRRSMKVRFVISPGREERSLFGPSSCPVHSISGIQGLIARPAIRQELASAAGGGTTPTPTPAGPVLSVCLSLSRSLPVCLYLFVSVSLVFPRCLSLSLSCARAHTLGWGLSPQPLPKCHLESKCNNLLCDRPGSPWRNPQQKAALSSPTRCSRACGREQGRIWPVEMTGTTVPSPFQDPVAIRIPSPSRPLGPARTAHPGRGAPVPGLPGSPGGRECAPGARRRRRSGRAGPGGREPNPQSLRRQEATTARRARAAQGTATAAAAAAAGLGSRPQPRGAARRYLSAARSPALDPCVRPSARRARELRSEDERGVLAAGTGSPRGDGKRWGEEARRLRQLPPLRMPRARGQRCRRGRVLWLAAAGAQRSLLARRLSARTRRAGAARLGWPPAPGCMLIRWGGGVPRFLRPTTGAGGRAAAAARSQPPPPAPLLRRGPQP